MKPKLIIGSISALAVAGITGALIAAPAGAAPHHRASPTGSVAYSDVHGHKVAHGLGAKIDPMSSRGGHARAQEIRPVTASVPDNYSLAQYDNGPGDQGQVNSCTAWAIDYSAMNILENEQGIQGHPQAPMYTYAQIVKGNNAGTSPYQHFDILASQGIDSQSDYWQGNYDYTTQPDAHERGNAANWKLSGYTRLQTGAGVADDVKKSIFSGLPVVVGIPVHQSWMDITAADAASYTYLPGDATSDPIVGNHEVTIIGYNSQGVRIENSWNAYWGDGGYINVPWAFVTQQVFEAESVGKLLPPTPTPSGTTTMNGRQAQVTAAPTTANISTHIVPGTTGAAAAKELSNAQVAAHRSVAAVMSRPKRSTQGGAAAQATDGQSHLAWGTMTQGTSAPTGMSATHSVAPSVRSTGEGSDVVYAPTMYPAGNACIEDTTAYGTNYAAIWAWDWCNGEHVGKYTSMDPSFLSTYTQNGAYQVSIIKTDAASNTWEMLLYNYQTSTWDPYYTSAGQTHTTGSTGWDVFETYSDTNTTTSELDVCTDTAGSSFTASNIQQRENGTWKYLTSENSYQYAPAGAIFGCSTLNAGYDAVNYQWTVTNT